MKKLVLLAVLVIAAILIFQPKANLPRKKESPAPLAQSEQSAAAPRSTTVATEPKTFALSAKQPIAPPEGQLPSDFDEAISMETARQRAWEISNHWQELFTLKDLSANRPPPGPNEAKHFRGFIGGPQGEKYIEMRFEPEQWIVFEGDTPDQLLPRPRRDVIPLRDNLDLWTLYFGNSERMLLRHLHKVHVPELNGDFEVLSGWDGRQDLFRRTALIGYDKGWPPLEVIQQLLPENPNR